MLRWCLAALLPFVVSACDLGLDPGKKVAPELARAIAEKRNVLIQRPGDTTAKVELATLLYQSGGWFEAADLFRDAAEAGAQDIRIHAGLANIYLSLGYVPSTVNELKACFSMDRNEPWCLFAFGSLMTADGTERALQEERRAWRHFLVVAPDHEKADYVRSRLKQLEGQLGAEEPPPPPMIPPDGPEGQMPPNHPPVDEEPMAAEVPGHGGADIEGADGVGELNPFGQAIMRAMAAVKVNDAAAAERAFADALKIRPEDPAALAGLAESHFAQGKMEAAIAAAEHAWKVAPDDAQVRWTFGLVMLENKRRMPEAVAAWEALAKDEPEYARRLGLKERLDSIKKFIQK